LVTCQKKGYNLLWTYLDPDIADDSDAIKKWCQDLIETKKPDGILLTPPYTNDEVINRYLGRSSIPIVRIGPNNIKDQNITVKIDDRLAARKATEYLVGLGHKRIAFIRGREDQDATQERFLGYKDTLDKSGILYNEELVFPGQFDFTSGMIAGETIMKMKDRPTAIFASNDDMAAGVIISAHKNNINIPEDISIIGFDDSEMAERIWPALTTIRQPRAEYGERSTDLLISLAGTRQRTHNAAPKDVIMDYDLIIRDSAGPPKH